MIDTDIMSLLCHISFYTSILIPIAIVIIAIKIKTNKKHVFLIVWSGLLIEIISLIPTLMLVVENDFFTMILIILFYYITDFWHLSPFILPIIIVALFVKKKKKTPSNVLLIVLLLIVEIAIIFLRLNYNSWLPITSVVTQIIR